MFKNFETCPLTVPTSSFVLIIVKRESERNVPQKNSNTDDSIGSHTNNDISEELPDSYNQSE